MSRAYYSTWIYPKPKGLIWYIGHHSVLKATETALKNPLTKLIDISLYTEHFPDIWKIANVIPVYKNKGGSKFPAYYRPTFLLSTVGTVVEWCIFEYLFNFISSNRLLTKHQPGLRPGDSIVNQLIARIYDFNKTKLSITKKRSGWCDISRAFDRVWHKGLLH